MRKYGLCLWTFGDVPLKEKLKLAQEIGVTGVEIEGDLNQDPTNLRSLLKKYNLEILSVTPDNVDISSDDEKVRKNAVKYFLNLLVWAKKVGSPRICLHGYVGKVRGSDEVSDDWSLLVESTKKIMQKAEELEVEVVFEVLNRYENYQIVTAKEASQLIDEVKSILLKVLLDSYHMNIEEASPIEAIKYTNKNLAVYHIADSNRQGIGMGHANLVNQIKALNEIEYTGPIIMEMVAEGPNPFTPIKDKNYINVVKDYYKHSLNKLKSI